MQVGAAIAQLCSNCGEKVVAHFCDWCYYLRTVRGDAFKKELYHEDERMRIDDGTAAGFGVSSGGSDLLLG